MEGPVKKTCSAVFFSQGSEIWLPLLTDYNPQEQLLERLYTHSLYQNNDAIAKNKKIVKLSQLLFSFFFAL